MIAAVAALAYLLLSEDVGGLKTEQQVEGQGESGLQSARIGPARIVDGDSLELGDLRVRLVGIDACELDQKAILDASSWPCGRIARQRLEALTRDKDVYCAWERRDPYGRVLAICHIEGSDIVLNDLMVSEGLAVAYRRRNQFGQLIITDPHFEALEDQARSKKAGLWAGEFEMPSDYRANAAR